MRFFGAKDRWASLLFKNEAGATVLVNGLRYWTMINEFLLLELEGMDVDDVYFEQDGAKCHTSDKNIGVWKVSRPSNFSKRRLQLAAEIFWLKDVLLPVDVLILL